MIPDPIRIWPGEAEALRLYAITQTPEGVDLLESWKTPDRAEALADALGTEGDIDAGRAVLLDPRELGGMTVPGYLSEGWDAPDDELMRLGGELDGLRAPLLILPPSVFGPAARDLAPSPALDVLGAIRLGPPGAAPGLATPSATGPAPRDDGPAPIETVKGQLTSTLWTAAILAIGIVALAIWLARAS